MWFYGSIIFYFLYSSSYANIVHINNCSPSSFCGDLHNISYPFRLKDDPKHCGGDSSYELTCENNNTTTFLYINSQKYHVKAINYHNYTIRLVDVAIKNNTCSFPQFSLHQKNFTDFYPYTIYHFISRWNISEITRPITFMSCPYPLKESSLFTETTGLCVSSNVKKHTYVRVGHFNVSDVGDKCTIDLTVMTSSWLFKNYSNISLSEIHASLRYGFELSWFGSLCGNCGGNICYQYYGNKPSCTQHCTNNDLSPSGGHYICENFLHPYSRFSIRRVALLILGFFIFTPKIFIGIPFLIWIFIYKFRTRHMSMFDVIESFLRSQNNLTPIRYSYSHIKKITKGFHDKVGKGGFGEVYKGKLRSGNAVAVKLLSKPKSNGQAFINKVATLGRIHHVNVVRLVGFCLEGSKCALVYEFMTNGSLDKYLFNKESPNSLSWEKKYQIALGVAHGIEYLHRGCDIQILHFDIKPHNILLDENFTAKVSDFGLVKFCSTEKDHVTLTAARGTIGYVAPELIDRSIGDVSYKADVYSFGMLLMEMVGLKRDIVLGNTESSSQYFPQWIYRHLEKGKDIELGDINDDDARKIKRKMTIVALWCIQMSPGDRPSMNKVVEMLETEVENLQIPVEPSQSALVAQEENQSWGTYSTDSI